MRSAAWEIVREYERSGAVSPGTEKASGFGEWSRLTPAWVLFAALKLEVLARQDAGDPVEKIVDDLRGPLSRDAATQLVRAAMGDMEEVRKTAPRSAVTLQNVAATLSAAWARDGVPDADVDFRLAAAEDVASDSVRLMTAADGAGWGRDTGPWDIREVRDTATAGLVDLGGLLVPVGAGVRLDPVYAGAEGPAVAITLFGAGTALQLQAYRARPGRSWDSVRAQLSRSVTASGGTAAEWAGPAGLELRARQPVQSGGAPHMMDVRFAGCDGPGWLLRATITGGGAAPESVEGWAYEVVRGTVVNSGYAPDPSADFVTLRWPPER